MNKTVKTVLTVIIVLIVLFLIALPKLSFLKEDSEASDSPGAAGAGSRAMPVEVMAVKSRILDNSINITGAVLANESIELTSEIPGKISAIYFKEGDQVKKGDLLVKINDEELKAQLEKLKYTRKLYEDMENRMSQLLEKDAISQEEYDVSLTELQTSTADINVLQAQIDKAQIRAPFSGVIGLRYVSEGAYLSPTTRIASLYSITPAKLEFSVPGRYGMHIRQGNTINFSVEGSEETFRGEIYAIEPRIDPETRTLTVRALSPNENRKLMPGQFVRIKLTIDSKEKAIMVPTISLVPQANGHLVYLVRDGVADSVKVQIGFRGAQEIEVLSGINEGDTLVVSGVQQIKDGDALRVQSVLN